MNPGRDERSATGEAFRRGRPPRAARRTTALVRDEILEKAVSMAGEVGLQAVTMRALGDALGVSAMSLYAHVRDKDDILDAVIQARLQHLGLPDIDLNWEKWIIQSAQDLRAMLVEEPALLDRYSRRPVGVPAALTRMETALDRLVHAGFAPTVAATIFAAVHTYTIGFAALEAARNAPESRSRRNTASWYHAEIQSWPEYFATFDGDRYPRLAALRPDLAAFTADEQFSLGLEALIVGLDRLHRDKT